MKSIAILVSVSDYDHGVGSLPACKNDVALIKTVLEYSNRFDDILEVDTKESSPTVKRKIAEFIKKYHNTDINEVLFYFSGHGANNQNDVLFLLKDFQELKQNTTSLPNSEIDDQVRTLNPVLFTKIIDACYSGAQYIKSQEDFSSQINKGKGKFRKIYFMFSSQQDQMSFASDKISDFTASFGRSICEAENAPLRHRDIISSIADEFSENNKSTSTSQIPIFVIQADHTEIFVEVTDELKQALHRFFDDPKILDGDGVEETDEAKPAKLSIIDRIKLDADKYCTKEEAFEVINQIKEQFFSFKLEGDLEGLYEIRLGALTEDVPSAEGIGNWLSSNDKNKDYFARPKIRQETYERRVPVDPIKELYTSSLFSYNRGNLFSNSNADGYKLISDVRTVVSGFEQTNTMEFEYLRILLEPKYPNVNQASCLIVPIFTVNKLRFFWANSHYRRVDWDRWSRVSPIAWSTDVCDIKNHAAVIGMMKRIISEFTSFVDIPLRQAWE